MNQGTNKAGAGLGTCLRGTRIAQPVNSSSSHQGGQGALTLGGHYGMGLMQTATASPANATGSSNSNTSSSSGLGTMSYSNHHPHHSSLPRGSRPRGGTS